MADLKTKLKNVFTSGDTYNVLTLLKKLIDEMEGVEFATPEDLQQVSEALGEISVTVNGLVEDYNELKLLFPIETTNIKPGEPGQVLITDSNGHTAWGNIQ